MLGYKARQRRGYGPLLVGTAGAVAIVAGKFFLDSDITGYAGVSLLVAASVWNAWPRKGATGMTGIHPGPYNENKI